MAGIIMSADATGNGSIYLGGENLRKTSSWKEDTALLDEEDDDEEEQRRDSLTMEVTIDTMVEEVLEVIDKTMQEKTKLRSFRIFLVLYIIFLAPCLWFLFEELLTPTIAPGVIPMTPSVVGLIGFVLTVFGMYGILRLIAPRLGWKYNIKSSAQHKEDLLRICRLSTSLAVVGRVANRVHASDGFLFIFLMIYYTAFVCIIYEVTKNLNIVLTRECVRNPFTIIITGTSSIVIVGVLTLHIIYAARDRELAEFLGFLFIGSLLHFCIFLAPGEAHGHIHHWYWAFAVAHICVFDSRTSQIAQAMFCGSYIHGVALFGVEKCFYDNADEDEHYT